jgi:hypothetical protein
MVAVGRGGRDRLFSGGAASAPLGPTEKPFFVTYLQLMLLYIFYLINKPRQCSCALLLQKSPLFLISPPMFFTSLSSFQAVGKDIKGFFLKSSILILGITYS